MSVPDCALDPEKWFPDEPLAPNAIEAQVACTRCPVRRGCARVALEDLDGSQGIWAGVFLEPRPSMRRRVAIDMLRVIAV